MDNLIMPDVQSLPIQPLQTSVDVKLDYIQRDITKIQTDIGVIKNDYPSRREFTEGLNNTRDKFAESVAELKGSIMFLQKIIYSFIGLFVLAVMAAIFKLVLK